MKRPSISALTVLLALVLQPAVDGAPQSESGPLPDRQISSRADPCVRLRAGGSTSRPVLDCLEPGTRVRLLGAITGWSHVRLLDGAEGWVDSGYLEMAPLASAPPTAAGGEDPAADLRRQVAALEGQLEAAASRRAATEDRLRKTVAAAEAAQNEAGRLRQRVQQLESAVAGGGEPDGQLAGARARVQELEQALATTEQRLQRAAEMTAEQERRIESLDAALAAARAGEADSRQQLAAAQERLRAGDEANATQRARIQELEANLPEARDRETAMQQDLATAQQRLRAAEESNARQASRIAQLESDLPAIQAREAESRAALAAVRERLQAAEQRQAEQASRIEELTGQLAAAEVQLAEARLRARLAPQDQPPPEPAAAPRTVEVRAPIVTMPEPPRVAVRAPAPAAEAPSEPTAGEQASPIDAAIDAVRAWAAAWSDQRVEDYLSFYAPGFRPPDGLGREAWERQRRQRLSRPSYIRVTITSLRAELIDERAVRATFRQGYESDTYADTVTKVLTLIDRDGRWRILAERAAP